MVALKSLDILIRCGTIEGKLPDCLSSFGYEFHPMPSVMKNNDWYGFYLPEKQQMFTVSRAFHPIGPSNSDVAVASYSRENNLVLLKEFEENTGISMQNEPGALLDRTTRMSLSMMFPLAQKQGPKIFEMMRSQMPELY
jgi:hypothetical protein